MVGRKAAVRARSFSSAALPRAPVRGMAVSAMLFAVPFFGVLFFLIV